MIFSEYKQFKELRKENLRGNIELILTDLLEEATKRLVSKHKPLGLKDNIKVAHEGGSIDKVARDKKEEKIGETAVNKDNRLNYEYNIRMIKIYYKNLIKLEKILEVF